MTNDNYTNCTNEELLDILKNYKTKCKFLDKYLRYHQPELYDELTRRTSFLEEFYGM